MKNVQDVYPLSPMQEFMLLHAISRPREDVLFDQFCYELEGGLDTAALRKAWEQLVERHPILRTAFVWEEVKAPMQVVRTSVTLPFTTLDWSDRSRQEQRNALTEYCRQDGEEPFNLSRAPLLRLTLIRLSAERHYLVWRSHHLLMDRWCLGTVLAELQDLYDALRTGRDATLPAARPFRDYIAWIRAQDPLAAERFWRNRLTGLNATASLTRTAPGVDRAETAIETITLPERDSQQLRSWARGCGLTMSSVVQGAWALVLNAYTGMQDVVFGLSVAGRPAELPGVESIVGCFISNLPVRARLSADLKVIDVLHSLQSAQHEQRRFEYVSPADIARFGPFEASQVPFDSLLVWLAPEPEKQACDGLRMSGLPGEVTTAYPLTLWVDDDPHGLSISARLGKDREAVAPLAEILQRLRTTLEHLLTGDARQPIASTPGFVGTEILQAMSPDRDDSHIEVHTAASDASHVSGREAIETDSVREMLQAHWRAVLGHGDFNGVDSFFDVGGTSLLAATLHVRIEASIRRSIPMLSLFRAPTFDAMVRTLMQANWPLKPELVFCLSRSGDGLPLFCVASPEVNTVGYALLATHLGSNRPIHVVQVPPETGQMRRISLRTLPELCARYVGAVRKARPHGPYCLLGTCSGSQIALEMARQLTDAGHDVPFVCILDTWAIYTMSRRRSAVRRVLQLAEYYLYRIRDLVTRPRRHASVEVQPSSPEIPDGSPVAPATAAADEDTDRQWLEEFGYRDNDPRLAKYPGTVTVFRRRRQRRWWRVGDHTLGWSGQAENVRVEQFDVFEHADFLREPDIRELTRRLDESLEAARDPDRDAVQEHDPAPGIDARRDNFATTEEIA